MWRKFVCPVEQLQLNATLCGGQSFRWKQINETTDKPEIPEYIGVMANCVWILKHTDNHLFYRIVSELPYPTNDFAIVRMKISKPKKSAKSSSNLLYADEYYEQLLKSYFRLNVDLEIYYKKWSDAHKHFQNEAGQFYAIRVLNQEPVENLFSFICSQNNNISRITTLVEKLCRNYGSKICDFNGVSYHSFPDIEPLAKSNVEAELRTEAFGYRAKFIQKSATEIIEKGGLKWFEKLQNLNYKEAHEELIKLTGIGPKVADCICLMSLNHLEAIPVDTHVYQIAMQHYLPTLKKTKSVTANIYNQIGDHFREIYGQYAGWAQTVLFCADLSKFRKEEKNEENQRKKMKK